MSGHEFRVYVSRMDVDIGNPGQRRPFVQEHEWMPFFVLDRR